MPTCLRLAALLALPLALGACENMNRTQQRALSGGAIGAITAPSGGRGRGRGRDWDDDD
jgi:hypothetical protein